MDCEANKRVVLVLKTKGARKGMGCKSSAIRSVRTPQQHITKFEANPFRRGHQYTRRTDAAARKVWNSANLRELGSVAPTTKTKPRIITPGLCCIHVKPKERKAMTMSPVALPPNPEYTENAPHAQQSAKMDFESLLSGAFLLHESIKRQTDESMVVLNTLASGVRKSA